MGILNLKLHQNKDRFLNQRGTVIVKKTYRVTVANRTDVISSIVNLNPDKDWKVEIGPWTSMRSNEQNKRYWEMLGQLGNHLGYTADEMHQMLAYKYLSYKNVVMDNEVVVVPSTASLTIKEFAEYMNNIENWASTLGFNFGD